MSIQYFTVCLYDIKTNNKPTPVLLKINNEIYIGETNTKGWLGVIEQ